MKALETKNKAANLFKTIIQNPEFAFEEGDAVRFTIDLNDRVFKDFSSKQLARAAKIQNGFIRSFEDDERLHLIFTKSEELVESLNRFDVVWPGF
jgi:hypothetical protein